MSRFPFVMPNSQRVLADVGFYQANNPMWVFDQRTFAFLEVNDAAIEHYGYSRKEFFTMTILDIRPTEDIPVVLSTTLRPSQLHESNAERWRHVRRDGSVIDVEITSRQFVFNDRPAELVSIRDLTLG